MPFRDLPPEPYAVEQRWRNDPLEASIGRSLPVELRLRSAVDGDQLTGMHGPDRDGDRWARTVVADLDGSAVGWGTVLLDAALRDLYFCEIEHY